MKKWDSGSSFPPMMLDHTHTEPRIAGILLPSVLPDLHWLQVALVSDSIYLQDQLKYSRKSKLHRGKIRTPAGSQWISIPVHPEDRNLPLHLCRVDGTTDWLTPLWRSIEYNYRNSIYFDFYEPELEDVFKRVAEIENYCDACDYLTSVWFNWLEIPMPNIIRNRMVDSGHAHVPEHSSVTIDQATGKLSNEDKNNIPIAALSPLESDMIMVRERHSLQYLPPTWGAIELHVPIPKYKQHFGSFFEDCCILDLIFAVGPESWRITDQMIHQAKKFLKLPSQN